MKHLRKGNHGMAVKLGGLLLCALLLISTVPQSLWAAAAEAGEESAAASVPAEAENPAGTNTALQVSAEQNEEQKKTAKASEETESSGEAPGKEQPVQAEVKAVSASNAITQLSLLPVGVADPQEIEAVISGNQISAAVPQGASGVKVALISVSADVSAVTHNGASVTAGYEGLSMGENTLTAEKTDGSTAAYQLTVTEETHTPSTNETVRVNFKDETGWLNAAAVAAHISKVTLSSGGEAAPDGTVPYVTIENVDATQAVTLSVAVQGTLYQTPSGQSVAFDHYNAEDNCYEVTVDLAKNNLEYTVLYVSGNTLLTGGSLTGVTAVRDQAPALTAAAPDGYAISSVAFYAEQLSNIGDLNGKTPVEEISVTPAGELKQSFAPAFTNNIPADTAAVTFVVRCQPAFTLNIEAGQNGSVTLDGTPVPTGTKTILFAADNAEHTLQCSPAADHRAVITSGGSVVAENQETAELTYKFRASPQSRALSLNIAFPIIQYTVTLPTLQNASVAVYQGETALTPVQNRVTVDSGTEIVLGVLTMWGYSVDPAALRYTVNGAESRFSNLDEQEDGEVRTEALTVTNHTTLSAGVTANGTESWGNSILFSATAQPGGGDAEEQPGQETGKELHLYPTDTLLSLAAAGSYGKLKIKYSTGGQGEDQTFIGPAIEFNKMEGSAASNQRVTIIGLSVAVSNSCEYTDVMLPGSSSQVIGGADNSLIYFFEKDVENPVLTKELSAVPGENGFAWTSEAGVSYYRGEAVIQGTVSDLMDWNNGIFNDGISAIWCEYSYPDAEGGAVTQSVSDENFPKEGAAAGKSDEAYSFSLPVQLPELESLTQVTVTVYVKDKAENRISAELVLLLDNGVPQLRETEAGQYPIEFKQENNSALSSAINFLTFGTFFKPTVTATVRLKDEVTRPHYAEGESGGAVPENPKLVMYDEDGAEVLTMEARSAEFTEHEATLLFQVPEEYQGACQGAFKLFVWDELGNASQIQVTVGNSNIGEDSSGVLMIEGTAPTASLEINPLGSQVYRGADGEIYSNDIGYRIRVSDEDSGLNTVRLKVNGTVLLEEDLSAGESVSDGEDGEGEASTIKKITEFLNDQCRNAGMSPGENGGYAAELFVGDNAGNITVQNLTTFVDRTAPQVMRYDFSVAGASEAYTPAGFTEEFQENVELTEYGFYFKSAVQVTVSASDGASGGSAASGVRGIAVYLRDYETGELRALLPDGSFTAVSSADLGGIEAVSGDSVAFVIPGAFKGQIFAKAIDNVSNQGEYLTPEGAIVETPERHAAEEHVAFSRPQTAYRTADGQDLYAADVRVGLTVTDTFSGIRTVEWSILAPQNDKRQSGRVEIAENGQPQVSGSTDCIGTWQIGNQANNLVYQLQNTLTVSNNSNRIEVVVKLTDRAGNVSEERESFSIDKTAPTIRVTFDNNSADPAFPDYYNAPRTATVVVTERNFDPALLSYSGTNTNGSVPGLVGWTTSVNAENPDLTTNTATLSFGTDGDYTFRVSLRDRAQNASAVFTQPQFTIDRTAPVMTVSYNDVPVHNERFYQEPRVATVTVTEHNFEASRVTLSVNGSPAAISGWEISGDTATAAISYSEDNDYVFTASYSDRAGNPGESIGPEAFTVDQQFDLLSVSGIENEKAYGREDAIEPVIRFRDVNLGDPSAVTVSLVQKVWGEDVEHPVEDPQMGEDGAYEIHLDFSDVKQENDGLYVLTVTAADQAGNYPTEKTEGVGKGIQDGSVKTTAENGVNSLVYTFSVNRFGSVYVYGEAVKALIQKDYVNSNFMEEQSDLKIEEYNLSGIKSAKVEVTRDGMPVDAAVTVEPESGSKTEKNESGWYRYEYTVPKETFGEPGAYLDGVYDITVSSEDESGNHPETLNYVNEAAPVIDSKSQRRADGGRIRFHLDSTPPALTVTGLEEGSIYSEAVAVTANAFDAMGLQSMNVYLNDNILHAFEISEEEDAADLNDFKGSFEIGESGESQHLRIEIIDLAGNRYDTEEKKENNPEELLFPLDITVSGNFFVRWRANVPLFWGSIAGVLVLLSAIVLLVVRLKKKAQKAK